MERSNNQDQSSRKASRTRLKEASIVPEVMCSWDEVASSEILILRDDVPKQPVERHPFDLEERTAVFGEAIVRFKNEFPATQPIIVSLISSLALEQASEPTIARPMRLFQRRTFVILSVIASRRQRKPDSSSVWWLRRSHRFQKKPGNYIGRRRSCSVFSPR